MEARQAMTEVTPQPKKFLFDLAFDENGFCAGEERDKPTYSQEQIDEARKESYDSGFAAGQKAAQEERAKRQDALLSEMGKKIAALTEESAEIWARQLEQLRQVALIIARKIIPAYIARHGVDEIEAIVKRAVTEMGREPRLVIRVAEGQFDDVKKRVDALTEGQAFNGDVVILGDPALEESDCRIEWASGGVERDVRGLWQDIERVLGEVPIPEELAAEETEKSDTPKSEPVLETKPEETNDPQTGETT